jgi:DNA gyrase/topoisomerase IV subunit B
MVSVLERSGSKIDSQNGQTKKELFFSEMMSLVQGSTIEDITETLKQKMEKSIELYEQKLG